MEDQDKKEKTIKDRIRSISSDISAISWLLLILLVITIFSSNKVFVTNEVEIKKEDISTYGVKKPKTYCSDEGILYWINGVVTIDSQKQYVLSVVYDNNQKPKKCEFK